MNQIKQISFSTGDRDNLDKLLCDRFWDRLQGIVKRNSLTIDNGKFGYSTFGNGFHIWSDKKWITCANGYKFDKDNNIIYYGNVSINER